MTLEKMAAECSTLRFCEVCSTACSDDIDSIMGLKIVKPDADKRCPECGGFLGEVTAVRKSPTVDLILDIAVTLYLREKERKQVSR